MTDDSTDRGYQIDSRRSAHLCDVGLPGYSAVVAIGPDGIEYLILAEDALVGTAAVVPSCGSLAHEQLGELPARCRDRVQLAPVRCGRRCRDGHACRQYVARPGAACPRHRHPSGGGGR